MKRRRLRGPVLASLFVLGFLLGTGVLGTSAIAGTTTTVTMPGSTTNSGTITDPGTVTDPPTTTAGGPPATTTGTTQGSSNSNNSNGSSNSSGATIGNDTSNSNSDPPVSQASTQSTPSTTPTAPCDTTEITCGNNAATNIALVSQTCDAVNANSVLNVNIQTVTGAPVKNLTIDPSTTCLNELSITQVVEQYCVACTVIVIPPPPPVIYVPEPGTTTVEDGGTTTTIEQTTTIQQQVTTVIRTRTIDEVVAYCLPKPAGSKSSLVYLDVSRKPSGVDAGAVPASYQPGVGMVCPQGNAAPTTTAVGTSMFTLTVPASFVSQQLRICVQEPTKTACRTLKITGGSTIAVPVSSNVSAKLLGGKPVPKPKSKAQIQKASSGFLLGLGLTQSGSKSSKGSKDSKGSKGSRGKHKEILTSHVTHVDKPRKGN